MIIIGITGRAGAGKDTAAIRLVQNHQFYKVAFADSLKLGLSAMLGVHGTWFSNPELKETVIPEIGKTPRYLMQTLGTEWGRRMVHPELWLRVAGAKIDRLIETGTDRIVVTDIRFEDEANMIRRRGGHIWHVVRPSTNIPVTHISEAGISTSPADHMLFNVSTVDQLHQAVETQIRRHIAVRAEA